MAADLFIALNATKSIVEGNFERTILLLIAYSHFLFFTTNRDTIRNHPTYSIFTQH